MTAVVDDVNHENIVRLADGADVLVDGVDNLETRYLANDYAVRHAVPYVYGAAVGTTGMAFPVLPHGDGNAPWEQAAGGNHATPCFRCLFEEAPPPGTVATCDTVGVIGPAVAMIANFQVAEALKILTGNYSRVTRTLNSVDLWANELSQLKVASAYDKGNCPCCKGRRFDYLDGRLGSSADVLCGRNAVQLRHRQQRSRIDLQTVAGQLHAHGRVQSSEFMVRATIDDRDNPYEITVFADGRAIVKGTDEPGVARSVYAKYVGA